MFSWLESEILAMSRTDYLVMLGILASGCAYLVYHSFRAFRRFRFVDGTATSKIRSAAQGLVELKGLGEWLPGDSITSPFSNSRCIWYHCTIEKRQRRGKRSSWTNIFDECSGDLFRLVDDTGWCVIDPDHAHVIAESDITWYGSSTDSRSKVPPRTRWLSLSIGGNYRFRERLIRPATSLYALGEFRSFQNNRAEEVIAKQVEDLLGQWKLQPQRYLVDYDFDGNGKIQQQEWKAIRAAARKRVLAKMNRQDSEHHLLLRPQDTRHPFILSAVAEEELVANKKLGAYTSVSVAFVLLAAVVIMSSLRPPFAH
jgi:hypothetical protein